MSKPKFLGMQSIHKPLINLLFSLTIAQLLLISPLYADWAEEIPIGAAFPRIQAQDHLVNPRTNENLMGENGLLYLFVRSSDWWPFCKKQLVQLQAYKKRFAELGVNVAVMTYDSVDKNAKFAKQFKINFPILSDTNGTTAIAFGILNEKYPVGHRAYGIPHPGIFFVDSKGLVKGKFAEEDFRDRPDFDDVFQFVSEKSKSQPI
jgi:peroxiredoxin